MGKLILRCANDRGATRDSQPGFTHEESHHDGTVQSVVNFVLFVKYRRDPMLIPQREARPQQLIVGEDKTKLDLSLGSRSFVNWVNE